MDERGDDNTMKLKPRIFNYSESTYGIKEFGANKKGSGRVDVTYFARVRSKNAMLQRLLKLPNMRNASANWIRERISQGEGGMEKIITDDSIYVMDDHSKVIGKFTLDNQWNPFDPPLKPHRPWLNHIGDDKTMSKTEMKHTFKTVNAKLSAFAVNPTPENFKALSVEISNMQTELREMSKTYMKHQIAEVLFEELLRE